MTKPHLRLKKIKALENLRLSLTYADGETLAVDLSDWISKTRLLKPLQNSALFAQARISSGGGVVEWKSGEIELAADNLRNLAIEQAGGIGHERIWEWLHDNQLTIEQGAKALGISRRMLIYYRDGEKPVPRTIWLACLGWQTCIDRSHR